MNEMGWAIVAIFGMLFVLPAIFILSIIVFACLRSFHVIHCSWWWISIPVVLLAAVLYIDERYGHIV